MGKWIHKLSQIDPVAQTAICAECGFVKIGLHKKSNKPSYWRCLKNHNKASSKPSNYKYRKHVKEVCEKCGFIPEDICQLDVDHIDGNHKNNDSSNLQTLCANCHRLKTKIQKDGMYAR